MAKEEKVRQVTIVVLGKYNDVFQGFYTSVEKFFPKVQKILVRDGQEIQLPKNAKNWTVVQGPEKFAMAGNGNLGLKAASKDHDILYCGDDVQILDGDLIKHLQAAAYKNSTVGIVSPKIIGRGSPLQVNPTYKLTQVHSLQMWFPCVYIKRDVLDNIGYLDEQFNDFGSDDFDFCLRTELAGYKLVVTNETSIVHSASPEGGPTTFCKAIGAEKWHSQEGVALEKLRQKYKLTHNDFRAFLTTGNIEILRTRAGAKELEDLPELDHTQEGMVCSREEAAEYIRKQHLFIATPCYGGVMACNYAMSLLGLINHCHNIGLKYTTSFIYNESLVTRARNRLANDFLKTDCTHMVQIDADIGFDPKDVISFLLYDKDIIGIPCARKNLRVDRVANAVKKNGREYSIAELESLMGEFVVNLPVGDNRQNIDISKLTEVMEVGTGLMFTRRQTFVNFIEAYPDSRYLQMSGEEGGRIPLYMFFQAGFDEQSREHNPESLPDYVSEDYYFCRAARRAGMKVWLAPWAVSTHMGSYMFKGDMRAVAVAGGSLR